MLSDQAYEILSKLEAGSFIGTHNEATGELIAAGLACDDWGKLAVTEAGRRVARGHVLSRAFAPDDDYYSDMWMSNPQRTAPPPRHNDETLKKILVEIEREEPPAPLAAAPDALTRAMRCAGIATGETGVEVDVKWVQSFIAAWTSRED